MKQMIGWLCSNERGTVVVLVAVLLLALLGMGALVVDAGSLYESRRRLVTMADSAAIAGATEWAAQVLFGDPASAPDAARTKALDYAVRNGAQASEVTVSVVEADRKVIVDLSRDNSLSFARVLGISSAQTGAHAAAVAGPVETIDEGALPIWVLPGLAGGIGSPDDVLLREGLPPPPDPGNFTFLGLGGGGTKILENNLRDGYPGTIAIGDTVETQTGSIPQPSANAVSDRIQRCLDNCVKEDGTECNYLLFAPGCPRVGQLVVCALIEDKITGHEELLVVGFISFFIDSAYKQSGNVIITGHPINYITEGKVIGSDGSGAGDYGTWAVNLIE